MKLKDIAKYVTDKISSDAIDLDCYVTTDSLLQNKAGREVAVNLPPQVCTLTHFRQGDILIGNIRPYLKKIWMADIDGGCNADVLVIRAKDGHSPSFIYALLLQDAFYEYAMKGAKGSKMPRGDKDQIMRYEIPTLSSTEESIGKFIVDIRDKIILLTQINRNLEAMVRQLYDYWFVQFDFPDENGRPYKSSGGKMVWNEKLKRDIPKGWKECTLHRYIGRITNGLNPRQNFVLGTGSNFYVSIRSLEGRDINWESCEKCDDSALAKINSRSQLQCGDVIFSAIGTIGRTYYIQEDPNNWNISETSFAIRPSKEIPSSFFYELLISPEIQMQADKNAMGSTMRCLVMDALCKIPTMDIPTNVVNKFNNIIAPIHNALYKRNKEKRNLYKLREELLPLLMNGQVSVMPLEVNCDLFHD